MECEAEITKLFDTLNELPIDKLREYWPDLQEWPDDDVLKYRDNFVKLQDLPKVVANLGEDELVYAKKYVPGEEFFILPFIGKTDCMDKLVRKYARYDAAMGYYAEKDPRVVDLIKEYTDGTKTYSHEHDTFFIRIICRSSYWKNKFDDAQVQIYPFDLEKTIIESFGRPWMSELVYFMTGDEYNVCGYKEFMENADLFIENEINKEL